MFTEKTKTYKLTFYLFISQSLPAISKKVHRHVAADLSLFFSGLSESEFIFYLKNSYYMFRRTTTRNTKKAQIIQRRSGHSLDRGLICEILFLFCF